MFQLLQAGSASDGFVGPSLALRASLEQYLVIARDMKKSGAGGVRTRDLLNAIQARSQLRHSPNV
jgi:hypothetical protein